MKTALIYTIIGLLAFNSLTAQVKIGDNPQNLNPASLLELESTSRALVISRVTDAQMSAISPLRGALVYNTDQNCLHYYDGTAWINICEALDDSFTTSTEDGTIVITQDGDNYDFSVGLIDSSNIPRNSIEGSDIAPGVIDSQHYANNSINPEEHFNGLASNTRQIIIWNGTDWVYTLESDLQISEADGVIGNEVVGPFDATLKLEGTGDEIDPYTLDVSEGGITDFEIATGAVTSDEILNGTILEEDIANDAVTITKIGTAGAADANRILGTDGTGTPQWQDSNTLATSIGENVISSNNSISGVQNNAALVAMDLEVNVDNSTLEVDPTNGVQIVDGGVITDKIADGNVTFAKFQNGTTDNNIIRWNATATQWEETNFSTGFGQNVESSDGSITGTQNNAALIAMDLGVNVDNSTLEVDPTNGVQIADGGVTTIKIADGDVTFAKFQNGTTDNNIIRWNATSTQWEETNLSTGLGQNVESTDGSITGVQNNAALVAMDLGVNVDNSTLEVDPTNGVQIVDGGVTFAKFQNGTTDNNIIRWNATSTQWEETNLSTGLGQNVESTDGSITGVQNNAALVAMDLEVNVDNSTLEVDPTNGVQIIDGGVTTNKILNGTILEEDIANGEVTPVKISPSASPTDGDILTTTGGTVSWQPPAVVAMGKVNGDGSHAKINGATATRNSIGNYTVTFTTARPDADYIIQLTLYGATAGSTIQVENQTNIGFTVSITSTQPNFNAVSPPFTTDLGGPTPQHTHTGFVDPFPIVDNLAFSPTDAIWYFTITDF
ncbi:hypothetical protein LDL77_12975 [Flagellimonas marinaquae]|uniref:hypothetical protein n=1 Tax=Flagellimonas aurea TaxID=2915619 RepID=UPI001CE117C6|nr:hypothetical protein LDL77_12975 [Allomuricauda aquimarina]